MIVIGIDVGGIKKGFHAVALEDGRYRDQTSSKEPAKLLQFCRAGFLAGHAGCLAGQPADERRRSGGSCPV